MNFAGVEKANSSNQQNAFESASGSCGMTNSGEDFVVSTTSNRNNVGVYNLAYSNQSNFCFQFLCVLDSGQQRSGNASDLIKTARENGLSYTNETRDFERSVESGGKQWLFW